MEVIFKTGRPKRPLAIFCAGAELYWEVNGVAMPPSSIQFANSVLKRVGIVKNELLAFCVISCLILNVFAIPLDALHSDRQNFAGLMMHLSTIPILLIFGAVYSYALFFLPSSQQELIFTEEAKRMVAQHKRKSKILCAEEEP
jgi:hypothetical protein